MFFHIYFKFNQINKNDNEDDKYNRENCITLSKTDIQLTNEQKDFLEKNYFLKKYLKDVW